MGLRVRGGPGTAVAHCCRGEGSPAQSDPWRYQVALKILPDDFAADPDRLARFTREAQILASLNHPNIAAIYGIEEAEGTRALVLELVVGDSLVIDPLCHPRAQVDSAPSRAARATDAR
ncbi:MAG: hypothetical protein E2P06_00870 [Acidobacteria bacterium]|nr:MAG: hypothetical protein E2P06_00870 [Acidobacteriota bacterium]